MFQFGLNVAGDARQRAVRRARALGAAPGDTNIMKQSSLARVLGSTYLAAVWINERQSTNVKKRCCFWPGSGTGSEDLTKSCFLQENTRKNDHFDKDHQG